MIDKELERKEIYDKFLSGMAVRKIANDYPYSLTYIQQLIKSYTYEEDIARNYPQIEGKNMFAVCKQTGKEFCDYSNMGGSITIYVFTLYPEEKVNSVYIRKAREQKTGKFWYDDYFIFEYRDVKPIKKCFYCDWTSEDVENKSGAYTEHLRIKHNKTVNEYLVDNPNDVEYFPNSYTAQPKEIECKICGERFHFLNSNHLAKHGMCMDEYKTMFNYPNMVSKQTSEKLHNQWKLHLKNKGFTRISSYETDILDSIPEVKFQIGNRKILDGLEIDLYSEEHKIGIEINGLYYHSELRGKKDRNYHINKTKVANQKGIKLIQVFEDEIFFKRDLVIDKIKHIFNVGESTKIHARKCNIVISKDGVNEFLNNNHIQGNCKSVIDICAYHNNELVAVMLFDNKRSFNREKIHNDNTFELVRFATKSGTTISGIASRLLKHFIKNHDVDRIISFADRRWTISNDNLYTKLGFELSKTLPPDHTYLNFKLHRTSRLHKFGFGKNKLKIKYSENYDNNKTEWVMMQEFGYDRIWDCGKFKYEMIIK